MRPSPETARNTPIEGVLLTNADLDHVLGLFLLREAGHLHLHAPKPVFEVLKNDLNLVDVLKPFCRIHYHEPSTKKTAPVLDSDDKPSGLHYRAIPLASKPPPYAAKNSEEGIQSVAYEIVDEKTKATVVVAPDVAEITTELLAAMESADAVLFDGTFWSNHEFEDLTGKKRTSDDMGHLPIHHGSLDILQEVKAQHKIYFHINNTNPILRADSPERIKIERAGMAVGIDGMELEI